VLIVVVKRLSARLEVLRILKKHLRGMHLVLSLLIGYLEERGVFEPGYFRQVPGGEAFAKPPNAAMEAHLDAHPSDWAGAYAAFGRAIAPTAASTPRGFFAQPKAEAWYAEREDGNAEALVRDDIPVLTRELVDEEQLASATADIRFSYGANTLSIFSEISRFLATLRGSTPDVIEGVGHSIYYHPDAAARYIRSQGEA
jgi:hypothetical protein